MGALIFSAFFGLLLLFLGLGKNKQWFSPVSVAGMILALIMTLRSWGVDSAWFGNMVIFDNYAIAFNAAMICTTLLIFLLGHEYYSDMEKNVAENYSLMMFSLCGAIVMTAFNNLIILFIGIEILSIPLYVLSGSKRHSLRSNEASFKYFLLGSVATAFLLFGITLIYGVTASFSLAEIKQFVLSQQHGLPMIFTTGMMMIFMALAFKVAAVPFHFWSPDVYEGSPTLITSFMATVVKTAGFAAFYRLLQQAFLPLPQSLSIMLWVMTLLTLFIGNFSALWQLSFKRLLAYSGIANAGFLLLAMVSLHPLSSNTLWYYSFTYSLATLSAFSVFFSVKKASGGKEQTEMFRGLWRQQPFLAVLFTLSLLSLAGIPPLAGFFAKYYVFFMTISQGYLWAAIFAIIMALVGIYYYFAVLRHVYSDQAEEKFIPLPTGSLVVLIFCALMLTVLGVFPPKIL